MTGYELADFSPDGHLHETCAPIFDGYTCHGNGKHMPDSLDCASILYAIAQDAELALARVTALAATVECEPDPSDYHRSHCPGCHTAHRIRTAAQESAT